MRRLIPYSNLLLFIAFHFFLIWSLVPLKNQIPATFAASAFTAMTLCMVLAARIPRIDRILNGAGRSYRLHRWLGYWAVVTTVVHWIKATPLGKGIVPAWAEFAGQSGEYAAIVMLALIGVAMLQMIPYHIWKFTHYLMGPLYMMVVFHTFFTAIPVTTGGLLWWVLVAIATIGIMAFLWTIIRHFIPAASYKVSAIYPLHQGLDIRVEATKNGQELSWQPGQFAMLSSERSGLREPHPFTICSAPDHSPIRFLVGNNGDYTARLIKNLRIGDMIGIREISGEFNPDFDERRPHRQIWVAGGIGISPFLAAIDAKKPDNGPQIDLFYCYRSLEHAIDIETLIAHAERLPQLVVHFLGEAESAFFDELTFPTCLSMGWEQAELFVCGPTPLIDSVCSAYRLHEGQNKINVELFEFRESVNFMNINKPKKRLQPTLAIQNTESQPFIGVQTFGA